MLGHLLVYDAEERYWGTRAFQGGKQGFLQKGVIILLPRMKKS